MVLLNCKKCLSSKSVKNGFIRGYQRYKCKECGLIYTDTKPRGKPAAMKALAVVMHTICNASFGMIARALGVSNVAVLNGSEKKHSSYQNLPWIQVPPSFKLMRCGILLMEKKQNLDLESL